MFNLTAIRQALRLFTDSPTGSILCMEVGFVATKKTSVFPEFVCLNEPTVCRIFPDGSHCIFPAEQKECQARQRGLSAWLPASFTPESPECLFFQVSIEDQKFDTAV